MWWGEGEVEFKVERLYEGEKREVGGEEFRAELKSAFLLMAETAEAPLLLPLPACLRPGLIPTSDHHQTPSAGDKDSRERNEEKDKPEK